MKDFLKRNYRKEMPLWLAEYNGNVDLMAIKNTPCVYYPGAGFDGQPIHTLYREPRQLFLRSCWR